MENGSVLLRVAFCLALLLPFGCYPLHAQSFSEKDFIHYTSRNGLSDNDVRAIQQDEHGYLWVGTGVGLNRFDGHHFTNYYAGNPTLPLGNDLIRKLKHFGPHELAIIGDGGLLVLNTTDFSSKTYTLPDTGAIGALRNRFWDATPLPGNNIALSSMAGFYVLNKHNQVNYRFDVYHETDIGNRTTRFGKDFFTLSGNELLLYHEESGLSHFNSNHNELKPVTASDKSLGVFTHPLTTPDDYWLFYSQLSPAEFLFMQRMKDSVVYYNRQRNLRRATPMPLRNWDEFNWNSKVLHFNDSIFLVNGGEKGLFSFHLDRQTGKIKFNTQKLLPSFTINSMFLDKDKRLWLGTTHGLLCMKQTIPPITTHVVMPTVADQQSYGYSAVYRYKDKLYLGRFSRTLGFIIADANTMQIEKQIQFDEHWAWNEVRSIQMYHPDTLWIGTNTGIIWLDTKTNHYGKVLDPDTHLPVDISAVLAPPHADGYAWVCSFLGGKAGRYHIASRRFTWFTENTTPALPFNKIKNIAYDPYGDVWLSGHSLTRWNNKESRFDTLIKVYAGLNKYNDDILTFTADNKGSLWLHNAYNGLLEYRITEKKFINYTTAHGLSTNTLRSLSPVVNDILWIADNTRLIRFNTVTKRFKIYTREDGVSDYRPSVRNIFYDSIQQLFYYSCQNEIVSFADETVSAANKNSDLLLQELNVNSDKSIFEPKDGIFLTPNENNLFFHFTVIDYESSDGYRFAYKLNDEENWQALDSQRVLALTKLAPGDYNLFLKAIGKSGIEKIKTLQFYIAVPLRKRTWFILLMGLLLAAAVIVFYRYRINQIRQKANMEKQMAELEMKGLYAQMNPHFVFNSLNGIREMILNNENKEASHFLGNFASIIRATLYQSQKPFVTLRQTMDHLTRYIEMEQVRNEAFTSRILADDELDPDEVVLPSMLIQPFVENALWHGTADNRKNININIDFKKQGNQLLCIVEDNGIGINQSLQSKINRSKTHQSMGIENIISRIQLLNEKYHLQSSVRISDKADLENYTGAGTVVQLILPIQMPES